MPLTNPSVPVQEDWTTPALTNSWTRRTTGSTPEGYYKDSLDIVRLRGNIKGGSLGQTIFTLPTGYRPPYSTGLVCYTDSPVQIGLLLIGTDGTVKLSSGALNSVVLDGLAFRVG